jgi:hypothetical protein
VKAAVIVTAALLMAAPLAVPLVQKAVVAFEARDTQAMHLADLGAMSDEIARLNAERDDLRHCRMVTNDGRKFFWPMRADGWCYTVDLDRR